MRFHVGYVRVRKLLVSLRRNDKKIQSLSKFIGVSLSRRHEDMSLMSSDNLFQLETRHWHEQFHRGLKTTPLRDSVT